MDGSIVSKFDVFYGDRYNTASVSATILATLDTQGCVGSKATGITEVSDDSLEGV
jgi:hypothetical protein